MKIEELRKILKKKYKKYVREIEYYKCGYIDLGPDYPAYKEFYISKKNLTIIITQLDGKECFEFWVQNDDEGEGCTLSTKMKGSDVIDLVNLIISYDLQYGDDWRGDDAEYEAGGFELDVTEV